MIAVTTESKLDLFANIIASADGRNTHKKPASLIERLNELVEAGASFDVGADDFQICGAVGSTDKAFLSINKIAVLCTLQQALLAQYLFAARPELLKEFIARVNERDARFEAVCEIAKKWFARLLETTADPAKQ